MSRSGSGKPDPVLQGVELLFQQIGGAASFGTKVAPSFEWNGSELYELNYWKAQNFEVILISYHTVSFENNCFPMFYITGT
jgi:hypothetical protein